MIWRRRRRRRELHRKRLDAVAYLMPVVRDQVPHFCPGRDWCIYCAEMREYRRRAAGGHRAL